MPMLLDRLRGEFNDLQNQIREIDADFAARDGEPTDAENDNYRALNDAMETLVPRIKTESERAQRMVAGADLLTAVPGDMETRLDATRTRAIDTELRSFEDHARAVALGELDANTRRELAEATLAWETRSRAFVDQTTPNVTGILPPTWLTDILEFVGTARPFVSAFNAAPLPAAGMTINYPRVTVRPQVGKQVTEKTDIPSRATTIVPLASQIQTWGGGEDVSLQVLQRSDPGYLGIVLELYAEEMATATDVYAITETLAVVPAGNHTLMDPADPKSVQAALTAAAKAIFGARGVPNTAVLGLDVWAAIANSVDLAGRPLFPDSSPSNPMGSSSLTSTSGTARGLNWVVDPNMPPKQGVIGWDRAVTTFLGGVQTLSADVPSKLGRDFAVFEFGTVAVRRPDALAEVHIA